MRFVGGMKAGVIRVIQSLARFFKTWERQLNLVVSSVYNAVIISLQAVIWYIYVTQLFHMVRATLPIQYAILHTFVSLYFLICVATNYVGCLRTKPSVPPQRGDVEEGLETRALNDSQALTKSQMWRVCEICCAPKPPRTHHCSICGKCYVRLCHHCPALGKCIARDNYPYFFRFLLTACIGSLFAGATCRALLAYESSWSHQMSSDEIYDRSFTLACVMLSAIGISIAVGTLAFWHVFLTATGQTTIEWLENRRVRSRGDAPTKWGFFGGPFSKDIRSNFKDAFGVPAFSFLPWCFVLFLPFPRSSGEFQLQ